MTDDVIRFNKPSLEGNELAYIQTAVETGHTSCSGPSPRSHRSCSATGSARADVLLTTSCTAALEMSALLLDLEPGDTVVVPSFTFTVDRPRVRARGRQDPLLRHRARDARPRPRASRALLDDSVRAVVPVHYAGVGCDIDGIDAAIGGRERRDRRGQRARPVRLLPRPPLGAFGRCSTLSFHETKNFICGEGGALVFNDESDVDRAHVLYDKGTNRRAVHARPGRQVLVAATSARRSGCRRARGVPATASSNSERDPGQAPCGHRDVLAMLEPSRPSSGSCIRRSADRDQAYHMFYVLLPDGRPATPCSNRLRARASSRRSTTCRCTARRPASEFAARPDRVPGHRRHQRPAAAAPVPQQPLGGRRRTRGRRLPARAHRRARTGTQLRRIATPPRRRRPGDR